MKDTAKIPSTISPMDLTRSPWEDSNRILKIPLGPPMPLHIYPLLVDQAVIQAEESPPTWLARGDPYLTIGRMELLPKK